VYILVFLFSRYTYLMTEPLLPTLNEIQEILNEEYAAIEREIQQVKKKEQVARDTQRIEELKHKLGTI